ncbi:MAG: ABC transporter permease [Candidatus Electrothrix sp. AX1]|nr:ABC transporter permease [Candidatus Electrothrix sp. AX1]
MFVSGSILFLLLLGLCLAGKQLAPHDPLAVDLMHRLAAPSTTYLLGTDQLGRCVLSRILCGAQNSLASALAAVGLALGIGLPLGLLAGLGTRRIDRLLTGLFDVVLAFPFLILALALTAVLGPSLSSLILGTGLAWWAWWARFIRGMALDAGDKDFVRQGRAMGLDRLCLLRQYILPQMLPPLLVTISLNTGRMIVVISSLSYLGLGVQPPEPEWGVMLRESMLHIASAPWLAVAPGLAASVAVLCFTLLGEGLKDYFQVRPVHVA